MSFRFLSPALVELKEAAEYYESALSGLGADFIDEVDSTIQRIVSFPEAWGRISEHYRHCITRRFPYALIYEMSGDQILIVSVFHLSREPCSWKKNL